MNKLFVVFFGFLLLSWHVPADARLGEENANIANIVAESDVVAVAKVTMAGTDLSQTGKSDDFPCVGAGGCYTMNVVRFIKGTTPITLAITFPPLFSGTWKFSQPPLSFNGAYVLIFLKQSSPGYYATSDLMPFYPVAGSAASGDLGSNPLTATLKVLCNSLSDPKLRVLAADTLAGVKDPDVVLAMSKYIDDPNDTLKQDVLICMALNTQVEAIPRIVNLVEKQSNKFDELDAYLTAYMLAAFKSHEDVPYLNPLVCNRSLLIRQSALRGLRDSADQTTEPYLILALRDPTSDFSIYSAAREILAEKIYGLSPSYQNRSDIQKNYKNEQRRYFNWWSDELSGKHLSTDDPKAVHEQQQEAAQSIPDNVDDINPLLFKPYPSLRERAIAALVNKATFTSVPYLVLALQDPDQTVSYNSYVILEWLIGENISPMSQADYFANQDAATKPLYQLWSDELETEPRPGKFEIE